MNAPVEFRFYARNFTLDHARNGVQPIRFQPAPGAPVQLVIPSVLQFRYKERVSLNGATTTQWSDWADVPTVIEPDLRSVQGSPSAA